MAGIMLSELKKKAVSLIGLWNDVLISLSK
jgi:hypothetical protein